MDEVALFRCLADPTRLAVLHRLREDGDRSVSQLVDATGQEQSNVSHHLAKLRECGLVVAEADGRRRRYRLAHPRLATILGEGRELVAHVEDQGLAACPPGGCC